MDAIQNTHEESVREAALLTLPEEISKLSLEIAGLSEEMASLRASIEAKGKTQTGW